MFPKARGFNKAKKLPKTMIYTGNSNLDTKIAHYRYTKTSFEQMESVIEPSDDYNDMVVVEGFQDKERILELSKKFKVNEFFVEDIFNVTQRNKYELIDDQIFIVLKYAFIENDNIDFRRIYFILKKGLVILFSDYENTYVNLLLERISKKIAMFTSYDESYIVYTIYDMIIDEQIEMTRLYKLELEDMESMIMQSNSSLSNDLFSLHKQFVKLRNNVNSLSENVSIREIIKSDFFHQNLLPFASDLEDHMFNLKEKLATNIDVCNSLITLYSTQISNRTNDVMKTLTIISVIFIPLSFITGIFGMNFVKFDLLQNQYGLIFFGLISISIVVGMLLWFKLRKWI